jgi:hypothetical protein
VERDVTAVLGPVLAALGLGGFVLPASAVVGGELEWVCCVGGSRWPAAVDLPVACRASVLPSTQERTTGTSPGRLSTCSGLPHP